MGGAAALGTRAGVWDPYNGLWRIFPWAVLAGALSFVLAFFWAALALFLNQGRAARYGAIALVGSIAFLYTPVYGIVMLRTMPPIHDISSDVSNPPQFSALLALRKSADTPASYEGPLTLRYRGKRTTVAALQEEILRPHPAHRDPDKSAGALLARVFTAKKMGWHLVAFDPTHGSIECTDTEFLVRLHRRHRDPCHPVGRRRAPRHPLEKQARRTRYGRERGAD